MIRGSSREQIVGSVPPNIVEVRDRPKDCLVMLILLVFFKKSQYHK